MLTSSLFLIRLFPLIERRAHPSISSILFQRLRSNPTQSKVMILCNAQLQGFIFRPAIATVWPSLSKKWAPLTHPKKRARESRKGKRLLNFCVSLPQIKTLGQLHTDAIALDIIILGLCFFNPW